VGLGLGLGQGGKNGERRVANWRSKGRFVEHETNGLPVTRRLLTNRLDENPGATNRTTAGRLRRDADAFDAEPRDGVLDRRKGDARVDEGAENHVPASAGEWIEDGDAGQMEDLFLANAVVGLPGSRV
jgi:hypothetical protein